MNNSFLTNIDAWQICILLAVCMFASTYFGNYLRKKGDTKGDEILPVESAVLALFGLLLAFTFSMAGSRYDMRREIIVKEANDIGTAILRADMYDDSTRNLFRANFKLYLKSRIDFFEAGNNTANINAATLQTQKAADNLWKIATDLSKKPSTTFAASNLMIPALNDMFDITVSYDAAHKSRVPDSILTLLFIMSIVSAFFLGYSIPFNKGINWYSIVGFTLLAITVIFIILDLDRPNRGFIQNTVSVQYIKSLQTQLK